MSVTSYKTSINKLAETYKKYLPILKGRKVLDYGSGRFTHNITNFCEENGIDITLYDPHNREISTLRKDDYDIVVCNNVLNVIEDDEIVQAIVDEVSSLGKTFILKVYDGDRSGIGRRTSINTFQRNCPAKDYLTFFKNDVNIKGNYVLGGNL